LADAPPRQLLIRNPSIKYLRFLRGNLACAQQNAEKALKAFSAGDGIGPSDFRLLDAEILSYQGRRPGAIALLKTLGDLFRPRAILPSESFALRVGIRQRSGHDEQSDAELRKAQYLSDASKSRLMAKSCKQSNHPNSPNSLPSRRSLQKKSAGCPGKRDSYLEQAISYTWPGRPPNEATTTSSDPFSMQPLHLARRFRRARSLKPPRNLGLTYYHLGDFEKALSIFSRRKAKRRDRNASPQIDWLMTPVIHYMLDKLQQARECFDQALKIAKGIDEPAEVAISNRPRFLPLSARAVRFGKGA